MPKKEGKIKRVNLRITEEEYYLWTMHCPKSLSAFIRGLVNEKVERILKGKFKNV